MLCACTRIQKQVAADDDVRQIEAAVVEEEEEEEEEEEDRARVGGGGWGGEKVMHTAVERGAERDSEDVSNLKRQTPSLHAPSRCSARGGEAVDGDGEGIGERSSDGKGDGEGGGGGREELVGVDGLGNICRWIGVWGGVARRRRKGRGPVFMEVEELG